MDHIRTRHKQLFEYWTINLRKDKAAFKVYSNHSPEILDYARFEDLATLVTVQWQLFRHIFDFGYENRNKAVFHDKMGQIAKVRNPLAHNRTIPENELWRAKVLCVDVLLALDSAGEITNKTK